jgi:hypothetical protein
VVVWERFLLLFSGVETPVAVCVVREEDKPQRPIAKAPVFDGKGINDEFDVSENGGEMVVAVYNNHRHFVVVDGVAVDGSRGVDMDRVVPCSLLQTLM